MRHMFHQIYQELVGCNGILIVTPRGHMIEINEDDSDCEAYALYSSPIDQFYLKYGLFTQRNQ
jgi:hypothetical protein